MKNLRLSLIILMLSTCTSSVMSQKEYVTTHEARHTHSNIPGGGHMDSYFFSDGSSIVIGVQPCASCHQSGACQICGGTGQVYSGYGMYGYWSMCNFCHGTGRCNLCQGTGNFITVVGGAGQSMQYFFLNSAGAAGTGTAVVHDYTTPSSSSRSSDRTYIEKIEYAPDYTGQQVRVWCDKCKAYAYPHSHIKQSVK